MVGRGGAAASSKTTLALLMTRLINGISAGDMLAGPVDAAMMCLMGVVL